MEGSLKSFLVKLTLFSAAVLGILLFFQSKASTSFQTTSFWAIWTFFAVVTAAIHYILVKVARQDSKKFITYFLGITGIKLFSYLIIIIIYSLLNRNHAQGFIVCFLIAYFLFSGFEVAMLLKHFKKPPSS